MWRHGAGIQGGDDSWADHFMPLQGWEWVDEGKYGLHPKWGFRTLEAGTSITLQARTPRCKCCCTWDSR